jgi:hypothetical protein
VPSLLRAYIASFRWNRPRRKGDVTPAGEKFCEILRQLS